MFGWTIDLNALAAHLVFVAAHFLWQGAILLACSMLAARLLANATPRARYTVQFACFVLLAVLPVATLALTWPANVVRRVPIVHVSGVPLVSSTEVRRELVRPMKADGASPPAPRTWRDFAPFCLAAYAAGAASLLVRVVWAVHGGMSLRRRAVPLREDAHLVLARRAATRLGARRLPMIGTCVDVLVPTVIGILRPAILLPPAALTGLTPSQLEAVFAHELAHLCRRDHIVELVQRIVESLLFFHPAVWIVSRRLRIERELCCDAMVVGAHGSDPRDYAASLLSVAEYAFARRTALRHVASLAAVSGRRSNLRDRIDRLLRPRVTTDIRVSRAWAIIAALAVVTVGSTASLRYGTRAVAESSTTKPATSQPHVIHLTVIDADTKQPIPHATVAIRRDPGKDGPPVQADENGSTDIPSRDVPMTYVELTASSPGRATMRVSWGARADDSPALPDAVTIPLPKGITIGGTVVDADGKPVGNARLTVSVRDDRVPDGVAKTGISYERIDADAEGRWTFAGVPETWKELDLGAFHLQRGGYEQGFYPMEEVTPADAIALRAGTLISKLPPVRLITGRLTDAAGKPIAKAEVGVGTDSVASNALPTADTDDDGRYAIGGKPDATITLTFRAKGFAPELKRVMNNDALGAVDQQLEPAKELTGRVVDPDGKPAAKAYVYIDTWRGTRTLRASLRTDADGQFSWKDAPADEVLVSVSANGYANINNASVKRGQENILTLRRPVNFRGKVIDAETKQPIATFKPDIGIVFSAQQPPSFHAMDGSGPPTITPDGTFEYLFEYPYAGRVVRVEADGYATADSNVITMTDGDQQFTYELHHAAGLTGTVVDADGKPVAGATLSLAVGGTTLQLQNGEVPKYSQRDVDQRKTDAAGHFSFSPQNGPFIVVASADAGYAMADQDTLKANGSVPLKPWSHVVGVAHVGSKVAGNADLQAYATDSAGGPYDPKAPHLMSSLKVKTDADGHFTIDHVPPGGWAMGRYVQVGDQSWSTANATRFEATPDATTTVEVGGKGRPVVGKVEVPAELKARTDWSFMSFDLSTKIEVPPLPKPMDVIRAMTEAERKAYAESPEAKAWQKAQRSAYANQTRYSAWIKPDGSFRIDDVLPGTYQISGQINQRPAGQPYNYGDILGSVQGIEVVVPPGDLDVPVELPPVSITLRKTLAVGQPVPDFDVPTLDGKTVKLKDLREKIVVLDFWATWCGPCVAEVPSMKAAFDRFGKDERFAMVSLSLDEKQDEPKAFVAKQSLGWTQGFLGEWAKATLPAAYGVDGIPSVFLIGPDGRLLAKNLRGEAVAQAVEAALAK